ncbi:hypothetical protein RESH_02200 [Rhodopirellula europaea SH398]|jgi:hypothetical protein|uniref:Uncharacterized protein n=1 Tax=Rhodopirellula europaea SH398 TaxID=1263868 RepID=M5S6C7_9BACT|nr:hypothetical protein RESH_02200 [Rhodopirellula europaea SH398]
MLCGNPFTTTAKNFRVFASKRKIEKNEAVPGSACLQFEQTEMNFNLARSMRRMRPFSALSIQRRVLANFVARVSCQRFFAASICPSNEDFKRQPTIHCCGRPESQHAAAIELSTPRRFIGGVQLWLSTFV